MTFVYLNSRVFGFCIQYFYILKLNVKCGIHRFGLQQNVLYENLTNFNWHEILNELFLSEYDTAVSLPTDGL